MGRRAQANNTPVRWSKLIEGYEVVYCPDDSLDDALRFKHVGRDYYQPAIVLRSV